MMADVQAKTGASDPANKQKDTNRRFNIVNYIVSTKLIKTMTIPQDPFMLLSFINMKMRDGDYSDLSELCDSLGCEEENIINTLKSAGFEYMPEMKQFR